jgi:filamentous hemagglutinin family protein
MAPGGGGSGGRASASNLLNAGSASAALTATRAREVLQKSDAAVAAMRALQSNARNLMAASPHEGLKAGWLEPYARNTDKSVKSGFDNGVADLSTWEGVDKQRTQLREGDHSVNIVQNQQSAYLYWKNFNIGSRTRVNFDQSAGGNDVGKWIAFNKVMGSASPSDIYGSITAQGQVYILNQNGILFRNGAQVNTRTLVASTLPINENLAGDALKKIAAAGIANNPDSQFLFSATKLEGNKNGLSKAFDPGLPPGTALGNVTVERGATITAPVDANNSGGLVALIGPEVKNEGTIRAPNGQVILAAGLQVGLNPHSSSDASLRGFDVAIGKVEDSAVKASAAAGSAINSGMIEFPRGNLTMAGKTIRQSGVAESSTSVALNGRMDLIASYNTAVNPSYNPSDKTLGPALFYGETGDLIMDAGSIVRILPEWGSSAKVPGTSLALNSVVSILGRNITMGPGSILLAPGATATAGAVSQTGSALANGVSITAGTWWYNPSNQVNTLTRSAGSIELRPGSEINVAGSTGVSVNSSKNFLNIELRGAELANSPLQRKGLIRGEKLTLDARISGIYNGQYWVGTPLGDATGFLNIIERTVDELTARGGSVLLSAGDSVGVGQGAVVDVSGGWVNYTAGSFATSKVWYQGQLIDISRATPDRVYDGIYQGGSTVQKSEKWGVTKTYSSILDPMRPRYQKAYLSGADGGSILIKAPVVTLSGELKGQVVTGPRQLRDASSLSTLPGISSFAVNLAGERVNNVLKRVETISRNPSTWVLSPSLASQGGFGSLSIHNHDGGIILGTGELLDLGPGGRLELEASDIKILGSILAPGGRVSISSSTTPYEILNAMAYVPQPFSETMLGVLQDRETGEVLAMYGNPVGGMQQVLKSDGTFSRISSDKLKIYDSGNILIGPASSINVAGLLSSGASDDGIWRAVMPYGGTISIIGYNTTLASGSGLDVSGGAIRTAEGWSYGNAGTITIASGQDAGVTSIFNGSLRLGAVLRGYAGTGGDPGTLAITAPSIVIGGTARDPRSLSIPSGFFNEGGFGSFKLSGLGVPIGNGDLKAGILIERGTEIRPEVKSQRVQANRGLQPYLVAAPYRAAPSITLSSGGVFDGTLPGGKQWMVFGSIRVEEGASIVSDPHLSVHQRSAFATGGRIALDSGSILIKGSLIAPGGSISITGSSTYPTNELDPEHPLPTVELSPGTLLSTRGVALKASSPEGMRKRFGAVLPGGAITIQGNLLARGGAVLDVSGTREQFDYFAEELGLHERNPTSRNVMHRDLIAYNSESSGGAITLQGGQFLYSDATLRAFSGGSTASGGSLSVSSSPFYRQSQLPLQPENNRDLNFTIVQGGDVIPVGGAPLLGGGHLAADRIMEGGFSSLDIKGNVKFSGPVSITMPGSLRVASGGIIKLDSKVTLKASYAALGSTFVPPLDPNSGLLTSFFDPNNKKVFAGLGTGLSHGAGALEVVAKTIDLGNLSLDGASSALLAADGGSIRGNGSMAMAGDLVMRAARIYPASGTSFLISVQNYDIATGRAAPDGTGKGSIVIQQSGLAGKPLSAAGSLFLFANSIDQGGTLLAPFGSIRLGTDGTEGIARDPISGLSPTVSSSVILRGSSVTSVSGAGLYLPHGSSTDGTSWKDPAGTDITAVGLPSRSVSMSAASLRVDSGAFIDLSGGGDVIAPRWVSGLGGTINYLADPIGEYDPAGSIGYRAGDKVSYQGSLWSAKQSSAGKVPTEGLYWTRVPESYAIVPGYSEDLAPQGYSEIGLKIGDKIQISSGSGLAAGVYTLLPARYANQPGAYVISSPLVTQSKMIPAVRPDGTARVFGTRFNTLSAPANSLSSFASIYEISSKSVLADKATFQPLRADSFFSSFSSSPANGASLVAKASAALVFNGVVSGSAAVNGRASSVDISSPLAFRISHTAGEGGPSLAILGANVLNSWSYGSLLLGATRKTAFGKSTELNVATPAITLDPSVTLEGGDIILAARNAITLGAGASLIASGAGQVADRDLSVNGNGVLARVSRDDGVNLSRTGVTSQQSQRDRAGAPVLSIAAGASLKSAGVILDSSFRVLIDPDTEIDSGSVTLNAGALSMVPLAVPAPGLDASDRESLLLSGDLLNTLVSSKKLSLGSYSSLSIYGPGSFGGPKMKSLSLSAGQIRGFGMGAGVVSLNADQILLENKLSADTPAPLGRNPDGSSLPSGILEFNADSILIGKNQLSIDQFSRVSLNASDIIQATDQGGLQVGAGNQISDLYVRTPLLSGESGASLSLKSTGALTFQTPYSELVVPAEMEWGLGVAFDIEGSSVSLGSILKAPGGRVDVHARDGDVIISSGIDVGGSAKAFDDVTKYTDAGAINLSSDRGSVVIASSADLNLSARPGGGSAGALSVKTPLGFFRLDPQAIVSAQAGVGGAAGRFSLEVSTLAVGETAPSSLSTMAPRITDAGFTESQDYRIRSGDVVVDGSIKAHDFSLSADNGSITVSPNGVIDASGETGGQIEIEASGSVRLAENALLNAKGLRYDAAGKGGSIYLSSGASIAGVSASGAQLNLVRDSKIELGVTEPVSRRDQFGGTLHLRTPQSRLAQAVIDSQITGASSIVLEGYRIYQPAAGLINPTLRNQILSDAQVFFGSAGTDAPGIALIKNGFQTQHGTDNARLFNIAPGVEIINRSGNLTLSSDWDLSSFRVGANRVPGYLSMRASDDVNFQAGGLSDGFQAKNSAGAPLASGADYRAILLDPNGSLPANYQSWSYDITAGADVTASDSSQTAPGSTAAVKIGKSFPNGQNVASNPGPNALTSTALSGYYQVIRTGTGDIAVRAAGRVEIWNQFASIYTAGTIAPDQNLGGAFDIPRPSFANQLNTSLGAAQQSPIYKAQFSLGGGNIEMVAGTDIVHLALQQGIEVEDSVRELPSNWLYRRGSIDPTTGLFELMSGTGGNNDVASTAWWVDFSNFFQGVGALGGGNISISAGRDIRNIDAVIPTNFRMPARDQLGNLIIAGSLDGIELGGGDLSLITGRNLDAGVYYVERGAGNLKVGGSIITNPTRDPLAPLLTQRKPGSPYEYLPTTLFAGKSGFTVRALGDVLMGPVANSFLMPQGINNGFWYRTFFSTYSSDSSLDLLSVGGDITMRNEIASTLTSSINPALWTWMSGFILRIPTTLLVSNYQPWLRLAEQSLSNELKSQMLLGPSRISLSSLAGDINLQGDLIANPSPSGDLQLLAQGSISGLNRMGYSMGSSSPANWKGATVTVSDASPDGIPGIATPLSQRSVLTGSDKNNATKNLSGLLTQELNATFRETGSFKGEADSLQFKQRLHDAQILHKADPEPLRIYAQGGDITGLTLYSPKKSFISASQEIGDVGLYIQNLSSSDISRVSAGGSIVLYDPSTESQAEAVAEVKGLVNIPRQSGDIQISGPGTLQVLAGGDLDLGNGPNNPDGTGVGITSVGNARNPALPFQSADLIVAAGLQGLDQIPLLDFASKVLKGDRGATYLKELKDRFTYSGQPPRVPLDASIFEDSFTEISSEEKQQLALQLFYLVLRDAGRDNKNKSSPDYGTFAAGTEAISQLFGDLEGRGDITTWSRDLKTKSGGNLSLLAPGGGVTLASVAAVETLAPPGIITEAGGTINMFTRDSVNLGIGRIFTLRGGDIMIWSDKGDIAAGASAKTVASAPPTRVLIDPQSGAVQNDLAGLATGGGIGALATVVGIPIADVDLYAPTGVIDAGDAGIRATGNLYLGATRILNANNISVGGTISGAPPAPPPPAAPNVSGATAASSASAGNNASAQAATKPPSERPKDEAPSVISVEVLGYGGGDAPAEEESKKSAGGASMAPPQASL